MSLFNNALMNKRTKPVHKNKTTSIEGSLSVIPNSKVRIDGMVAQ
jgi:hypothetical protein